jgi:mRNA interferase MazF
LTNSHSTGVCFVFNRKSNFSVYIQNNTGNRHSPTVVIAAITSQVDTKKPLPTHISINAKLLAKNSIALLEQIRTIDKSRLGKYIGNLDEKYMKGIDQALAISVGIE